MKRFVSIQILSSCGYSLVEKVQDQKTGQIYISKSVDLLADERILHQFNNEIEILSTLAHSNIPTIVDVYEENGRRYLIESFIEGENLASFMKKGPGAKLKIDLLIQLAYLLQMLHDHGYLYLDLKPENLLIYKGRLNLIDFNACIERGSLQAYLASSCWSDPDLVYYRKKDIDSDLYSFARLMQFMKLPVIYKGLIKKCLHKKSSLSSMKELIEKMQAFQILKKRAKILCLFLSVFIVALFDLTNLNLPLMAYQEKGKIELMQESKDREPAEVLCEWIENGSLKPEMLIQSEDAAYFWNQILKSEDSNLAYWVLTHLKKEELLKNPKRYVSLLLLSRIELDENEKKTIEQLIASLKDEKLLKEYLSYLLEFEDIIQNPGPLFDFMSWNQNSTCRLLYLQYALLYKSKTGQNLKYKDSWICQDSNEFNNLYEIYIESL